MKIIAFYLPQFHEVEENNEWWGKGFTEWTNIRSAKALFQGHEQPVKPINDNYYDLTDKETVQWQTELADKYNVHGFCYYNYWFSGKKILEKPAENLLKWTDIKQNFCFCWANHTWKKTWNGTMEVLIEQTYGDLTEWEQHFDYLKDYFTDPRYLKKDNKPILMIYNAKDIPNLDQRIKYYNDRCKDLGFDGIYVIESLSTQSDHAVAKNSSGVLLREPSIALFWMDPISRLKRKLRRTISRIKYGVTNYSYQSVCKDSLNYAEQFKSSKSVFLGSFAGWDSTPRHSSRGYVIGGFSKSRFRKYLTKQIQQIRRKNYEDIIFFNAWNEWAEGMYLEPDTFTGYDRLEVIKEVTEQSK